MKPPSKSKQTVSKPLIFGIGSVIVATAVGIIVLCCQFVDSIEEQSAKLRKLKVKTAESIENKASVGASK